MSSSRAKRVLVVDDNVDAAQALKSFLELAGHQVVAATDPVAAMEIAEKLEPDVCILDIELPIMDGYELGSRLRDLPGVKSSVLVALTGYSQEHDRHRSQNAGFDHYLVKPADFHLLARIVDSAAPSNGHATLTTA
jgi:CheY-like chemotaxis protein